MDFSRVSRVFAWFQVDFSWGLRVFAGVSGVQVDFSRVQEGLFPEFQENLKNFSLFPENSQYIRLQVVEFTEFSRNLIHQYE